MRQVRLHRGEDLAGTREGEGPEGELSPSYARACGSEPDQWFEVLAPTLVHDFERITSSFIPGTGVGLSIMPVSLIRFMTEACMLA